MSATQRDQDEQDWRIEQMSSNIELMRAEGRKLRAEDEKLRAEGEKLRADIRVAGERIAFDKKAEIWKIIMQASIGAAALLGAGVALGRFIVFRQ